MSFYKEKRMMLCLISMMFMMIPDFPYDKQFNMILCNAVYRALQKSSTKRKGSYLKGRGKLIKDKLMITTIRLGLR